MDIVGERTIVDLLGEKAEQYGDRIFIVHEDQAGEISELSYADLRIRAQNTATALRKAGLEQNDRVYVLLRNTPDYVPLWFGILSAGAIMVPGNIYLTSPELAFQLMHCRPRLIITEPSLLPAISNSAVDLSDSRIIVIDGDGNDEYTAFESLYVETSTYQPSDIRSDDVAEILYTSGTSARPKGVMLTHANLLWCGISSASSDALRADDRLFNNKPLFHANCQASVLACLTSGATCIIGERYSASRYLSQLIKHRATICSLSGMLCRTLLNQPESDLDDQHNLRSARYAINISEDEIQAFTKRYGVPIKNGYGLSEAMLAVTHEWVGGPSTYPSIGRPAMGREVFIVDEHNHILSPNEVGEIVVRGRPGRDLMLGYYDDARATEAAFEGGWLHTGDLGSMDTNGNFYFFGRAKEVIKRAGENISAAEVEEVLVGHPAVRDVAVIGIPDPIRDQAVKAFVVVRDGENINTEELREFCRARLAYFKVPEAIAFISELPRNASGKVLKRALDSLTEVTE